MRHHSDVSNSDDIIDIRNVIERFEELETERSDFNDLIADQQEIIDDPESSEEDKDDARREIESLHNNIHEWVGDNEHEFNTLKELLDDLAGYGGDHQWRGEWYPVTLIRDSHFRDYAETLADEIGAMDSNAGWPMNCIDWDEAAKQLKMDYSTVEFGEVTYWYR